MANYAETAVLLAILGGDENEALRILRDFLPGELVALEDAIDNVSECIAKVQEENRVADGRD